MTVDQINGMKHCIGYEISRVKKGKYEAYRNYYNNGEQKDDGWEELVSKGYAKQYVRFDQIIYCVTDEGKKLLESILDIKITERD
ncbi:hypothetical protein D3C77_752840 [compost metagenome]